MQPDDRDVIGDYEKVWDEWRGTKDIATFVDQHLETRRRFHAVLDDIISRLPEHARIIELGCGTAIDTGILSRKHTAHLFLATDLSRNAAALALRVSGRFENRFQVFTADMRDLPFGPASMDIVFSQGVMEHFRDPRPFFKEQIELLKPGGYLIVSVPQKYTGYTWFKHRQMRKGLWTLGWETEFSYSRLRKIVCGFGLTEEKHLGEGYWKSRFEPVFVLRDSADKIYRFLPVRVRGPLLWPLEAYHALWDFLEEKAGHLFMQNVIIVFRKP